MLLLCYEISKQYEPWTEELQAAREEMPAGKGWYLRVDVLELVSLALKILQTGFSFHF